MKAVKYIREVFNSTFIGMTATPLTAKGDFIGGFEHILDYTSVPQMIADGYLAPTRFYSAGNITDGLSIKRGEYVEAEVEQALSKQGLYDHIVKLNDKQHHWDTEHKTIIFASSIKIGQSMLNKFDRPSVKILHSNLSKSEYTDTLAWFRGTKAGIVINCRILTTGFNEPTVDSLVLLSPSNIKSLVMQTLFRASTIDPNNPDKIAQVYDFGGSLAKHSPFFDDWYKEPKLTCMEQAKLLTDDEERMYAMLACDPKPIVTICNGKLPSSYVNNPYVIDFAITTPHLKPCGEVMSIHDMKYATTEDKKNRGIIYKWTKCKCGYTTKVALKCMSTPSDLIEVHTDTPLASTNKVIAIYSKEHNKCLLVIDDPKLVSYKFVFATSQDSIFKQCKSILNSSPFSLSSNINLSKLTNAHLNKSLDNIVQLVDWDDETKNTGLMRKLCKNRLDSLNVQFGYKKGLTYHVNKHITNKNLKYCVQTLGKKLSREQYTAFRKKIEDEYARNNRPKLSTMSTNSMDFDIDESDIPF